MSHKYCIQEQICSNLLLFFYFRVVKYEILHFFIKQTDVRILFHSPAGILLHRFVIITLPLDFGNGLFFFLIRKRREIRLFYSRPVVENDVSVAVLAVVFSFSSSV